MQEPELANQIVTLHSQGETIERIMVTLKCKKHKVRYHTDATYKFLCNQRSKASKKKSRQIKKKKTIDLFGGKCQICFYDKCQNALNFHHINPSTKCFEISDAFFRLNIPEKELQEELKKCILVCANCHNEIHAGVIEIPKNMKNPLTSEESVVNCSCSLEGVVSADSESEKKAETPLTIEESVIDCPCSSNNASVAQR